MTNDNKLIAEFMDIQNTGMSIYSEDEYQYDSSWDWLMPVVHKIDEKCRERLGLNHSLHIGDDIDAVHSQVVEFIKTYNNEEKENTKRVR